MNWLQRLLTALARRLRIGWPKHYTALLSQGVYVLTGSDATFLYTPASDTTPDQFLFTDQSGVATSTVITSSPVTITGLGTGVSITLNASGGTIDKNANANFLGSQNVQNGDTVRARVTSSASNSTGANCTVAANPSGVQDTFTATTAGAVGGTALSYLSGWSGDSTFTNGSVLNITRAANDLGSGPQIVVFGNFRGGTPGTAVPASQQIGAFTTMGASDGQSSSTNRPMYSTGPDGDTWADIMNSAMANFGDGGTVQMDVFGTTHFDTFYASWHQLTNGPVAGSGYSSFNQKTLWVVRNGDIGGGGTEGTSNDTFMSARVCGGNSGFEGNFWDAPSHGVDTTGIAAPNGGYPASGHRQYQSFGIRPHTAPATQGALYDSIIQNVSSDGYYRNSSTGLSHAWHSTGGAYWDSFFFLGYMQMRGASPAITSYKVKDFLFQIGDNAWKRFFITDSATITATSVIYDCPHTAWASGGVSIYIPYGFTATGKHLWYANGSTFTRLASS